jgi:hypothetical protein
MKLMSARTSDIGGRMKLMSARTSDIDGRMKLMSPTTTLVGPLRTLRWGLVSEIRGLVKLLG